VNIYLVPYTWARHVHVALITGSTALVAWWTMLVYVQLFGAPWPLEADGPVYLGVIASAVAVSSLLAEGGLHRHDLKWFVLRIPGGLALSFGVAVGGVLLFRLIGGAILPDNLGIDAADPALVSLRYSLLAFAVAGLGSALGTLTPTAPRSASWGTSHRAPTCGCRSRKGSRSSTSPSASTTRRTTGPTV
jgi:hypothetical protein